MMIIDDQIAIIGSANINDRSLKGNRDSEIAAIIEDKELVASKMNGENYMASKFAHTLRCELYKEHFQIEQVNDPLSPLLMAQINNQTLQNTLLYREIFRCYPDDEVKDISQLKQFISQGQPNLYPYKAHYFKGNAVQWPLKFLEDENMKFQIHMKEFYCPDINFT